MKFLIAITLAAVVGLLGCSPGGLSITGTQCSGDLGSFVAQCITNRGGRAISTNVPAIQVQWTYQYRPPEDVILVSGDHFSEVRSLLRQAYGDPDPSVDSLSSPAHPMGGAQMGFYGLKQIGVGLNFTGDARQTVICIIGPAAPQPKPLGGANGWQPVGAGTNSASAVTGSRDSP